MTRRERLLATLAGKPVDRPAVSFYEIGGWRMDPDGSEYSVWNDPSWRPLVDLANAETDIMRLVEPAWSGGPVDGFGTTASIHVSFAGGSRITRVTVEAEGRDLTLVTRRDPGVQTDWVIEHPFKCVADVQAYLRLPEPMLGEADVPALLAEERSLGDAGILCVDIADPIGTACGLFSMEAYTVLALEEPALFHRLLERFLAILRPACERLARALPGRLWRIYGPEYASEPYLPPRLYREYVTRYTGPLVRCIRESGGQVRIHSHGKLRAVLPEIAVMEPDALDPLEPPPQGDMQLDEIKRAIGAHTVLMGNIEASDIETLPPRAFERKVVSALREGTEGGGRGFVLLPTACPYGRVVSPLAMENYRTMLRLAKGGETNAGA